MTEVRNFIAEIPRAGKTFAKIKTMCEEAYGDQALKRTPINANLEKVKVWKTTKDQRHLNAQKTKMGEDIVPAVTAPVEKDHRVTVQDLSLVFGVSYGTIYIIFHNNLGLSKKLARWVPQLMSDKQMQERVHLSQDIFTAVQGDAGQYCHHGWTLVCYPTPQTKKQSKQCMKNGTPGPIKARVHAV